ncbi:MAG: ROK family protein [Pyrinomonadaceae bacterium]|nr:ROK family protein [Pyrinomonadaceae bacterium]
MADQQHQPAIAGVDIGGTNIRCAVAGLEAPSRILSRRSIRTPADAEPRALVELISHQIDLCLSEAGLTRETLVSVGCAAPGIIDVEAGVIISAANLEGWRDVPLARLLEARFGVPAAVENDVRVAALGEFKYGAGRMKEGCRSLVYMTISTGVSAGIIVDGKPLRGAHYFAGELGYFLPDPAHIGKDWGINGCLELTAAGVGIAQEWATRHKNLSTDFSAADVFTSAHAGDVEATQIIERASNYLAQAAVAVCTIIDPEVFVLGGGIAENEPQLISRIRDVVRTTIPYPPPVVKAELGGDSPLIGALALAATPKP